MHTQKVPVLKDVFLIPAKMENTVKFNMLSSAVKDHLKIDLGINAAF